MANSVSHASIPYPIKNARYTIAVPYLDADGDPTDPTTPDTELSGDAGAFADCAEEVTTITGSNGTGYITLTGAETNYSLVAVCAKVASGPKATLAILQPRNLPILESGTAGAGAAGTITLASGTYTGLNLSGCFIRTTGGTGGGGTGGANNQARRITSYNTGTRVATVTPNWETTPDNTTTYDVLLPEGILVPMLTALAPTTLARTLDVSSGGEAGVDWANVGSPTTTLALTGTTIASTQKVDLETIKTNPVVNAGTVTFPTTATLASTTNITAGTITTATNVTNGVTVTTNNDKTGYSLTATTGLGNQTANITGNLSGSVGSVTGAVGSVTGAVGSVTGNVGGNVTGSVGSIATGGIAAASFAAGAIDAAAIATGAIDADALAADAGAEIATAVWTDTTAGDFTVALSVGKSIMNGVSLGTGLTVAAVSGAVGSVTGNVGGNVVGSVGSVVGAVGSVTGNVGGNVTGSVGSIATGGIAAASFAAGAIDAAAIATDAIDADAIKADAVTEIQSGLATAAELAKVPKSDSNVTWNATALASIQQEATDALNAYDPPTNAEMEARTIVAANYSTLTASQVWTLTDGVETGVTPKQALQRIGATTTGKASGIGTGTEIYVGMDGSTTRVTVTLDGSNNRTAVVYV